MDELTIQMERLNKLRKRELEVLYLVSQGHTYAQVGDLLSITERTVLYHMTNIYQKLDILELNRGSRQRELGKYFHALNKLQATGFTPPPEPLPQPGPAAAVEEAEPDQDDQRPSESETQAPSQAQLALILVKDDEEDLVVMQTRAIQLWEVPTPHFSPVPQVHTFERFWANLLRPLQIIFFIGMASVLVLVGGLIGYFIGVSKNSTVIAQSPPSAPSVSATTQPTPTLASAAPSPDPSPITASPPLTASPGLTIVPTPGHGFVPVCGETDRKDMPGSMGELVRTQGVIAFNEANTQKALLNNRVRALTIDQRGLWLGYFTTTVNPANGVGFYDFNQIALCPTPPGPLSSGAGNVNAIQVDQKNQVWVGTEKDGVLRYDGKAWERFTTLDKSLPSDEIFALTVDKNNVVWVGTWKGIAKYDVKGWTTPYTEENHSLSSNPVHAIAFDSNEDMWVGHIDTGISRLSTKENKWLYYKAPAPGASGAATANTLGGNQVRGIVVRKADTQTPEQVWVATNDGGVSKYEQGVWTVYQVKDGLPSNQVFAVALDKYNRVWAATDKGVVYFTGTRWLTYTNLSTLAIAFGCQGCPADRDDEHVWLGTETSGITHTRLPYPDNAVEIKEVCFVNQEGGRTCKTVNNQTEAATITVKYPTPLAPGELLRFEVNATPVGAYQFTNSDFLSNVDNNLYGSYQQVAVNVPGGVVKAGEVFTFTDHRTPFVAPALAPAEQERTFESVWRMWNHTRYAGPYLKLEFTVHQP